MIQLIKLQDKFILVSDEKIIHNATIYCEKTGLINASVCGVLPVNPRLVIAGIEDTPSIDFSILSEEDCKKIGYVSEDRMIVAAQQYALDKCQDNMSALTKVKVAWEEGFKTAQSLNDNMFSLENMNEAFRLGHDVEREDCKENYLNYIQSLKQNSWQVEIEVECAYGDECPSKGSYDSQYLCKVVPKITDNNSIKITKIV